MNGVSLSSFSWVFATIRRTCSLQEKGSYMYLEEKGSICTYSLEEKGFYMYLEVRRERFYMYLYFVVN